MKNITLEIDSESAGKRLDAFLASKFPEYSRSYIQNLIKRGDVLVDNSAARPALKLKSGTTVSLVLPCCDNKVEPEPEAIPLNILYEDNDVLVINKQPGLVVHPAAGNKTGTLVNALLAYYPEIGQAVFDDSSAISKSRPGLVHRLDKDTSGLMIIAKNPRSLKSLSKQLQNRQIKKIYMALCFGWPDSEKGRIISYLGRDPQDRKKISDIGRGKGREAISDYFVERYYTCGKDKISLLKFDIKTGRTHQIRVQAKQIGHPVLGDTLYGNKPSSILSGRLGIKRQLLHACQLSFYLPGQTTRTIVSSAVPNDFTDIIKRCEVEA